MLWICSSCAATPLCSNSAVQQLRCAATPLCSNSAVQQLRCAATPLCSNSAVQQTNQTYLHKMKRRSFVKKSSAGIVSAAILLNLVNASTAMANSSGGTSSSGGTGPKKKWTQKFKVRYPNNNIGSQFEHTEQEVTDVQTSNNTINPGSSEASQFSTNWEAVGNETVLEYWDPERPHDVSTEVISRDPDPCRPRSVEDTDDELWYVEAEVTVTIEESELDMNPE
jgi:hypothetical protein